jgi:hypothetical protein
VFAFTRERDGDCVLVILNLSGEERSFTLEGDAHAGPYRDAFSGEDIALKGRDSMTLGPWGYRLGEKQRADQAR